MGNVKAQTLIPFSFAQSSHGGTLDTVKGERVMGFPEVITLLPEADMQLEGIRAWVLQGEKHQLIFFEMEPSARVPEHSHDYPQWGMVIEGKMELVIDGEPRICKKGDEYVIPAHAKHYARFLSKSRLVDLFSEKNRYRLKSIK
jgi:quercetin dioxygenase-like cupin family protein